MISSQVNLIILKDISLGLSECADFASIDEISYVDNFNDFSNAPLVGGSSLWGDGIYTGYLATLPNTVIIIANTHAHAFLQNVNLDSFIKIIDEHYNTLFNDINAGHQIACFIDIFKPR